MMISSAISIYIHWPFCESKCPYCDFNSHVMRSIDEEEWVKAICLELTRYHRMTAYPFVKTIFFGGGTPSLMSPHAVQHILDHIFKLWDQTHRDHVEISMEANPGSVEADRFKGYRLAGVNRLSLGIQSLRDDSLKTLGRKHSVNEALAALLIAQNTFDRVSFDLIYARPHQTLEEWQAELNEALQLGTSHLSLYQLTIEPGTAFAPLYERGDLVIPKESEAYDLYVLTHKMTESHGFNAYEISNYAKEGQECQHNLTYWHYGDYIGVGPGAHGRIHSHDQRYATQQHKAPTTWLSSVMTNGTGDQGMIPIDLETAFQEQLMMGLRLNRGVRIGDLMRPFSKLEYQKIQQLVHEGLLVYETNGDAAAIYPTFDGRLVLNGILSYILFNP